MRSRKTGAVSGEGGGSCELEIHCAGGGKGDGQRTSTSGVVRLPIRGQRGPPGSPGPKGEKGHSGTDGESGLHLMFYSVAQKRKPLPNYQTNGVC